MKQEQKQPFCIFGPSCRFQTTFVKWKHKNQSHCYNPNPDEDDEHDHDENDQDKDDHNKDNHKKKPQEKKKKKIWKIKCKIYLGFFQFIIHTLWEVE